MSKHIKMLFFNEQMRCDEGWRLYCYHLQLEQVLAQDQEQITICKSIIAIEFTWSWLKSQSNLLILLHSLQSVDDTLFFPDIYKEVSFVLNDKWYQILMLKEHNKWLPSMMYVDEWEKNLTKRASMIWFCRVRKASVTLINILQIRNLP